MTAHARRSMIGRSVVLLAAGICLWGGFVGSARAELLNLLTPKPDITTNYIVVNYDDLTGAFTANGWPATFVVEPSGPEYGIVGAPGFDISLTLDSFGVPVSVGTLNIAGKIDELGTNTGTLLTGNITQFGFSPPPGGAGTRFEFVATVTGGDLASYYWGVSKGWANVVLHNNDSDFHGLFNESYSGDGLAFSDTAAVPEPSTLGLLSGLVACVLGMWASRRFRMMWRAT